MALLLVAACSKSGTDAGGQGTQSESAPSVILKTSVGEIEIELFPDKAPESVKNFLAYVDEGFYDGTIFHRVIKDFMIQGGGYDGGRQKKPTRSPIKNEANNGLKNETGTVAMARTSVPDSATSQFFVNVENNAFLDHREPTPEGWGYAVFGRVTRGMDVVEKIENAETEDGGGAFRNIPKSPVVIESARRKP
ncbi:MAG: peptidylprolyl isomerase [Myxococcota bacterium]|nr:peptidylprolyl isomerase [Myxococcota bacterium]